ncbi:hypothetical protein H2203_005399 [Taxawa tesnikishii (nom. ined.)]|nr:hypothetical protein H2203_005399 [Dothideales sp. JES 119]
MVVESPKATASPNSPFFPYPYSLWPLPPDLKRGLIAPGLLGLLSATSTLGVLTFIVWRFFKWRSHYRTYIGYNQYVVLVMNLLLAELAQGISFLYSFHWIAQNGIFAPTRTCFAQGMLLHLGDVASGFFVLAIALHTFYSAVKGARVSYATFVCSVIGIWILTLVLTFIGPIQHREHYFVRAGAWCWVSPEYEKERLVLHYIWIFLDQFGTIIIYAMILLHLRRTMSMIQPAAATSSTYAKVDRATKIMVVYPFSYILLTLPLSAGRMWSMAHDGANLPDAYACVAGALLGSCGWVDAMLYTLTRRSLLKNSMPGSDGAQSGGNGSHKSTGQKSSWELEEVNFGITQTRTVTVTDHRVSSDAAFVEEERGRNTLDQKSKRGVSPTGSLDPIISGRGIGMPPSAAAKTGTTVEVTAEPAVEDDARSSASSDSITVYPNREYRARGSTRVHW